MILGPFEVASVPTLTVFVQGLLSFFSPCVLPLLPVYLSYLSGGAKRVDETGRTVYPRGRVFVNTLAFVVGIGFAFFVLGLAATRLGSALRDPRTRAWIVRVAGCVIIVLGLVQLGVFHRVRWLSTTRRLPVAFDRLRMNPLVALVFGFVFSFAWTPCMSATLGSVLMMASVASTEAMGFALIGVYTLGFSVPFLIVGLFTAEVLAWLSRHRSSARVATWIGAGLMIVIGVLMVSGLFSRVSGALLA